jgi:hypothetical protein
MTVGKSMIPERYGPERTDGKLKRLLANDPSGEQVAYG